MEDSNFEKQPIGGVDPHDHTRRGNRLPQWLSVLIAALALVTLVLMLMLISSAQDNAQSSSKSIGTAAVTSTETSTTETRPIIVVKVEEWLTENGALGSSSSGKSTTTQVSTKPISSPVEPEEPAAPAAPAVEPTTQLVLTGVDEDVASARARSAGLTPYSVYTFPAIAAADGVSLPRAGQVFRWEPFNGRIQGEKFAFLYAQTTEPLSSAVTVPSLQGKSWREAQSSLAKVGLKIRFEYEHESPSTYGTVVFQAPASGSLMPRGCSAIVVLAD